MSQDGGGGAIPIASYLGYLELGRPDLYTDKSVVEARPHYKGSGAKYKHTFLVVILSAVIFILVISWVGVLQSYYDSVYIDEVIEKQVQSRLMTALTVSTAAIIGAVGVYIFWD